MRERKHRWYRRKKERRRSVRKKASEPGIPLTIRFELGLYFVCACVRVYARGYNYVREFYFACVIVRFSLIVFCFLLKGYDYCRLGLGHQLVCVLALLIVIFSASFVDIREFLQQSCFVSGMEMLGHVILL